MKIRHRPELPPLHVLPLPQLSRRLCQRFRLGPGETVTTHGVVAKRRKAAVRIKPHPFISENLYRLFPLGYDLVDCSDINVLLIAHAHTNTKSFGWRLENFSLVSTWCASL